MVALGRGTGNGAHACVNEWIGMVLQLCACMHHPLCIPGHIGRVPSAVVSALRHVNGVLCHWLLEPAPLSLHLLQMTAARHGTF